jgi:hypothetical protein
MATSMVQNNKKRKSQDITPKPDDNVVQVGNTKYKLQRTKYCPGGFYTEIPPVFSDDEDEDDYEVDEDDLEIRCPKCINAKFGCYECNLHKQMHEDEYIGPVPEKIPENVQKAWNVVQEYLEKRKDHIEARMEFTQHAPFHSDGLEYAYGEDGYRRLPIDCFPVLPDLMMDVFKDCIRTTRNHVENVSGIRQSLIGGDIPPKLKDNDEPAINDLVDQLYDIQQIIGE